MKRSATFLAAWLLLAPAAAAATFVDGKPTHVAALRCALVFPRTMLEVGWGFPWTVQPFTGIGIFNLQSRPDTAHMLNLEPDERTDPTLKIDLQPTLGGQPAALLMKRYIANAQYSTPSFKVETPPVAVKLGAVQASRAVFSEPAAKRGRRRWKVFYTIPAKGRAYYLSGLVNPEGKATFFPVFDACARTFKAD